MSKLYTERVRAWTELDTPKTPGKPARQQSSNPKRERQKARRDNKRSKARNRRIPPGTILVFDTETTTDIYQNLQIGSYMLFSIDPADWTMWLFEEGLFYADDLPSTDPTGFKILTEYWEKGRQPRGDFVAGEMGDITTAGSAGWLKRYEAVLADVDTTINRDTWLISALERVTGHKAGQPVEWQSEDGTSHKWPNPPHSSRVNSDEITTIAWFQRRLPRQAESELMLMPASAFVNDVLYEVGYPKYSHAGRKVSREPKPATIVGANLAFDISRLAVSIAPGRTGGMYAGGFSLGLLRDDDGQAVTMEDPKHDGNIQLARRGARGMMTGFSHMESGDRDYFTDILNLAWSLTNEIYNLDSAARTFDPYRKYFKAHVDEYGTITEELITYCRDDVHATAAAYCGLMSEVARHTELYDETRAYSPAALPKRYYQAMNIVPPLTKQPDFPREILGHAMTTFYAGRSEAHIRKTAVPVAYLDFTSMYPTVDINMRLWDCVTAERIEVREATTEIQDLLDSVTIDDLFRPEKYLELRGIALIERNGNLLPARVSFGTESNTIATAYLTSDNPRWYAIPDLVNDKILTGNPAKVLKAYVFYPSDEKQKDLEPVKLRSSIRINPSAEDFFKIAMEQRQAIKRLIDDDETHESHCVNGQCERHRLSGALKVTANSGSYGVFAEFNQEPNKGAVPSKVRVYGTDSEPILADIDRFDEPGNFAFPPIATLITSAARLQLGMLEKLVTDAGGTWAFCDTDSMAIVATDHGGDIETKAGIIHALSFTEVDEIQARFDSLNPYDPRIAPGIHTLKREHTKDQRQLYAYAISAKRYGLFHFRSDGSVEIVPKDGRKEHGLGSYLSPYNPNSEDVQRGNRRHATEIWEYLISRSIGRPVPEPSFFDLPIMCRVPISTWNSYIQFDCYNGRCDHPEHPAKPLCRQIKPFNFFMAPVASKRGLQSIKAADSSNGKPLRLVAPYERDMTKWLDLDYMDTNNSGKTFRITTDRLTGSIVGDSEASVRVVTWCDFVEDFDAHPEVKYCDADGKTCTTDTMGELHRHHLAIGRIEYIGKESNRLADNDEPLPDLVPYEVPVYGSLRDDVRELALPVLARLLPGFSNRELARQFECAETSIRRYFARENLTVGVNRKEHRDIKNTIISLAVNLAVKDMEKDTDFDPAWAVNSNHIKMRWEILTGWRDKQ